MSKKDKKVEETKLMKALDELEEHVEKGGAIPDEMKNPNGGLATEGKDLADEVSASETKKGKKPDIAIKGGKKRKKAMDMSSDGDDDSSSDEEGSEDDSMSKGGNSDEGSEEIEKKYSASDDGSSASASESMSKAGDASSSSGSASMSKSGKKKSTKKGLKESLKERAEGNDTIEKAMDVSNFLENLVDVISDSNGELAKAVLEENERKATFDGRLSKALILIGKTVNAQGEMIKSLVERLEGTADPNRMRKSLLSKGDVVERFEGGEDGKDKADHNDPVFRERVKAVLINKAMRGEIDAGIVTAYESRLGGVPPGLIKSIEDEIIKSER